jgi:hypothetical protein
MVRNTHDYFGICETSFMRKLNYDFVPRRQEKRRAKRRTRTSKGFIRLEGGFASRICIILDLSDSGARISVEGVSKIPPFLYLDDIEGFARAERPREVATRHRDRHRICVISDYWRNFDQSNLLDCRHTKFEFAGDVMVTS